MLPERVVGRPANGGELICPEADPDGLFFWRDLPCDIGLVHPAVLWRGVEQGPHRIVVSYYNGSVFGCTCGATFAFGDAEVCKPEPQPGHSPDCGACLNRPGDGARRMYHTMLPETQKPLVPPTGLAEALTWARAEIATIEADERYHYKPANVQVNAPLALEQIGMSSRMQVLKKVLELLGGRT